MENTKRTTTVSSNIGRGCEHCGEWVGADDSGDIGASINHYIGQHGYRLLHVGSQTSHDAEGKPWHSTVAILGHDAPPAIAPTPEIQILNIVVEPPRAS